MTPAQLLRLGPSKTFQSLNQSSISLTGLSSKWRSMGMPRASKGGRWETWILSCWFMETAIPISRRILIMTLWREKRQDLVNSKTPKEPINQEWGFTHSLKIERWLREIERSLPLKIWRPNHWWRRLSIPKSFKMELAVGALRWRRKRCCEREHRELVKTKSVLNFSKITSFSDIPILKPSKHT